jgi:hypothetical protein
MWPAIYLGASLIQVAVLHTTVPTIRGVQAPCWLGEVQFMVDKFRSIKAEEITQFRSSSPIIIMLKDNWKLQLWISLKKYFLTTRGWDFEAQKPSSSIWHVQLTVKGALVVCAILINTPVRRAWEHTLEAKCLVFRNAINEDWVSTYQG